MPSSPPLLVVGIDIAARTLARDHGDQCGERSTSARRALPILQPFSARLLARGKGKKVALVAVVRKLLALMVTLLIHERDCDPAWATRHAHATH